MSSKLPINFKSFNSKFCSAQCLSWCIPSLVKNANLSWVFFDFSRHFHTWVWPNFDILPKWGGKEVFGSKTIVNLGIVVIFIIKLRLSQLKNDNVKCSLKRQFKNSLISWKNFVLSFGYSLFYILDYSINSEKDDFLRKHFWAIYRLNGNHLDMKLG